MIIEVDETTGQAVTYKSLNALLHAHDSEIVETYRKRFAPEIQINLWNKDIIKSILPKNAGDIVKITSHSSYIVVATTNDIYSLDRIGAYPYFKLNLKPWQEF